jgi:dolichol-phosphate mannosyltransferase
MIRVVEPAGAMSMNHKILVCPIAYNENVKLRNAIERFLRSPIRSRVDYMVVDDGSDDGTSEMVAEFAEQGVETLRHKTRQGVGAGIRDAIFWARHHRYDILVIMAGNDKDNPDEIHRLIDPITNDGHDFVQGSRYLQPGGTGGDMPLYRKIATRIHPWLMRRITGRRVTDTTNGFRAFRLALFDDPRIDIRQEWMDEYELEPYLLYKALVLGYRFAEVPVTKIYPAKSLGYTKMKPLTGWWSILKPLIYLGLRIRE